MIMHFDDMSMPLQPRPKMQFFGKDGKKKFKPSAKMQAAMQEVLARTGAGWKPEYRPTAERHGVNWRSLETLVGKYRKGLVELGEPMKIEGKHEIEVRAELQRSLGLLAEYERHLNDAFEELLKKAEQELAKGNLMAFETVGLPTVVQAIATTTGLRAKKEKGVLEILERLLELQCTRGSVSGSSAEPNSPPMNQAVSASLLQSDAIAKIRNVFGRSGR